MALLGTGIWADAAQSNRLWDKIRCLQTPPGDVLQDFIVAGKLLGEEKLEKFAVMAVLAGIVLHNDRRVSVDASCLLPKKLLDTEELTEWLGHFLAKLPAGQEDGIDNLGKAFSKLFRDPKWLLNSYGLEKHKAISTPRELKLLLSDCVRVGANEGEGGERLRSRLLPSFCVFSATNSYWSQVILSGFL